MTVPAEVLRPWSRLRLAVTLRRTENSRLRSTEGEVQCDFFQKDFLKQFMPFIHYKVTNLRQQSTLDCSRRPEAFVERAFRVCKNHERRINSGSLHFSNHVLSYATTLCGLSTEIIVREPDRKLANFFHFTPGFKVVCSRNDFTLCAFPEELTTITSVTEVTLVFSLNFGNGQSTSSTFRGGGEGRLNECPS